MPIYSTASSQKEFDNSELLPIGMYVGKLVKLQEKMGQWEGQEREKVVWMFDTEKERRKDDSPFRLFLRTGLSYGNDKAMLTKVITWIYGQTFTEEEWEGFDLEGLLTIKFNLMVGQESWKNDIDPTTGKPRIHNSVVGLSPVSKESLPAPPNLGRPLWGPPQDAAHKAAIKGALQGVKPTYGLKGDVAAEAEADAEDEQPPILTDRQKATLAKRLKLTPEEAETMDVRGRLETDEGWDPFELMDGE